MNLEAMKIVRDNLKMGSVLSFAEVMIIQQAIDAAMLNAEPVAGWIKCSDRMPGAVGLYCCCVDEDKTSGKRNCVINCLWDGNGWDEPAVRALGGTVTHWMPLPAAPEQEV